MKANKGDDSNVFYKLPHELLDEIIDYIENTSELIELEWGNARNLQEIKDDKAMPDIYYKLKRYELKSEKNG